MEISPTTFNEYYDQISSVEAELCHHKELRKKNIFSFVINTIFLIVIFIFSHSFLYLDAFWKRFLFTLSFCGLLYIALFTYKKISPTVERAVSLHGCLVGCFGTLLYLIKKALLYLFLVMLIGFIIILILDELVGVYSWIVSPVGKLTLIVIVLSTIAFLSYVLYMYRMIVEILYCKVLTERKNLLEEYYQQNHTNLL